MIYLAFALEPVIIVYAGLAVSGFIMGLRDPWPGYSSMRGRFNIFTWLDYWNDLGSALAVRRGASVPSHKRRMR